MCPYSTSRAQLRTEGLTQPPMGPGPRRLRTHQPHEAPRIHRTEATRRSRASRDANRPDLSGTTTLSHVARSRRCQVPVSRSTSRRSCQTAGARRHTDHADAGERHRFHHIACYRSGGTFPIRWNPPDGGRPPSSAQARQRHDGRRKHTPRPTPSVARAPASPTPPSTMPETNPRPTRIIQQPLRGTAGQDASTRKRAAVGT